MGQNFRERINSKIRAFIAIGVVVFSLFAYLLLPTFYNPHQFARAASAPSIITYQGKLIDSAGLSVTTTVSMKFVLYNSSSGGTTLYTASGTLPTTSTISVTPINGLFSVNLGDTGTNSLDPSLFQNNQTVYLEVAVGGETLSPRKQITASPYSYNSKFLDGIAATSTASSSTYIPVSDSSGNFNLNHITSTQLSVSGTSTLATTTITGLTVSGDVTAQSYKDALAWVMSQSNLAKLQNGFNNGGFGGGATPANLPLTTTSVSYFNTAAVSSTSKGFEGAVFDGRYIYLVPNNTGDPLGNNTNLPSGKITRYDTILGFNSTSSYSFFDVSTLNTNARGFSGAVFDGRYIYFVPFKNSASDDSINSGASGLVARYDTLQAFSNSAAWAFFDATALGDGVTAFSGAIFDGRYIYLVPKGYEDLINGYSSWGNIIKYDTTQDFTNSSSWAVSSVTLNGYKSAVFDGRYIYLVPNIDSGNGFVSIIYRFDATNQAGFSDGSGWSTHDVNPGSGTDRPMFYSGAVFDGRYVYFIPANPAYTGVYGGDITRYDTTQSFSSGSAWKHFRLDKSWTGVDTGYNGAVFDGRYLYLVPGITTTANFGAHPHSNLGRFDTSQSFTASSSYSFFNLANGNSSAKDFVGGIFDGRYVYLAPNNNSAGGVLTRINAYAGGVDAAKSVKQIASGADFYIDSSGNIGVGTTTPTAALQIISTATSTRGLIVQGVASQGVNLAEFRNSAGTALVYIDQNGGLTVTGTSTLATTTITVLNVSGTSTLLGNVGIGTATPTAQLEIDVASTSPGLVVKGLPNNQPAGDLLQLLDDSGTPYLNMDKDGNLQIFYGGMPKQRLGATNHVLSSDSALIFYNNPNIYAAGVQDVGLSRYGAGVLAVGNGLAISNASGTLVAASIGVGTTSPAYALDVRGTLGVSGTSTFIDNVLIGTTTAQSYKLFIDSGASTTAGLGVNGYVQASGFITGSTTLDLAETYPINPACVETNSCPEPGDTVCLANNNGTMEQLDNQQIIEKCATPYSSSAIGIVSTNPGFTLGDPFNPNTRKVALSGRVPLKVSAKNGEIKSGDRLATSDISGVAVKATSDGLSIAIALEDFSGNNGTIEQANNQSTITAFVNISWWLPSLTDIISPSSTPSAEPTSIFSRVLDWFKNIGIIIEEGLIRVKKLIVDDELCINQTCINENQLKQVLDNNLITPSSPISPVSSGTVTATQPDSSSAASTTVITTLDVTSSSTDPALSSASSPVLDLNSSGFTTSSSSTSP